MPFHLVFPELALNNYFAVIVISSQIKGEDGNKLLSPPQSGGC